MQVTLKQLEAMIDQCASAPKGERAKLRASALAALRKCGVKSGNARKLLDGVLAEKRSEIKRFTCVDGPAVSLPYHSDTATAPQGCKCELDVTECNSASEPTKSIY